MNEEFLKVLLGIDQNLMDKFLTNTEDNLQILLDEEQLFVDYTWLDYIEECIPFLDSIIRSPKVINEQQELFYMEKVKETRNLYENRFIKTLVSKLYEFLQLQIINMPNEIKMDQNIKIKYDSNSIIDNQAIQFKLTIDKQKLDSYDTLIKTKTDIEERIKRVYMIVSGFYLSPFMQSLERAKLINGDIEKTEVMTTEINYKKMYELWQYLYNYPKNSKEEKVFYQHKKKQVLERQLAITTYLVNEMANNYQVIDKDSDFWKNYINKVIEYIVYESNMDEKTFKRIVNNRFNEVKEKKNNRDKNIINGFNKVFDSYNKQMKDAIRLLK